MAACLSKSNQQTPVKHSGLSCLHLKVKEKRKKKEGRTVRLPRV
uniref:Uncharacterized protein n=1 Tax=Anguilla anguilla TaxID=7936 RepID=A0A0E9VRG0_ANGAN